MSLGWGSVLGKIFTFIPGRVERLKNERDRLVQEKTELLRGRANATRVARVQELTDRIAALDLKLRNKTQD